MIARETTAETATASAPNKVQDWFTPGRFAAILGLLIAATFLEVLTGQSTFFYRDFGVFTYPVAHYYQECFWRGELPLWDPLNNCGVPLLAQWNTAILYPPSLFYLLFPLSWSLGVFNVCHLFFAGLGMYFLARRWTGNSLAAALAGLVFGFNGLTWHMLMWISNLAAWAWMPWVVLAVERAWRPGWRSLSLAALAGAMQMLAGAPEIILFTWGILGVLWLREWMQRETPRRLLLARMLAAVALVGGLSAAQLLPFLDLLRYSTRDPGFSDAGWSMPLAGVANFLVPLFRAQDNAGHGVYVQYDQYWTPSVYVGAGIVALALLAAWRVRGARVWILTGAAVFGLVLALGSHAFLYPALKSVFPQLGVMRYPIKFIALPLFALPLLAAYGLSWALARPRDSKSADGNIVLAAVVVGVLIGVILFWAWQYPKTWEKWPVIFQNGLGRLGWLVLSAGLLVLLRRAGELKLQKLCALALLVVLWADVYTHAPKINPTVERGVYQPDAIRAYLHLQPPQFGEPRFMPTLGAIEKVRYLSLPTPSADYLYRRFALYDDSNLLDDIPKTDGFFSVELLGSTRLLGVMANEQAQGAELKGMLDYLGVGHISAPDSSTNNSPVWMARASALPLITAGQRPVFADGTNTAMALFSPEFNPREVIYLPTMARPYITASNQVAARLAPVQLTPEKLEFEVSTPAATMVSVAQTYYHPWHAYLDGRAVQLWSANYAFQALEVPAGNHSVRLVYEDQGFFRGLVVSAVSLVLCAFLWFRKSRRIAIPAP